MEPLARGWGRWLSAVVGYVGLSQSQREMEGRRGGENKHVIGRWVDRRGKGRRGETGEGIKREEET